MNPSDQNQSSLSLIEQELVHSLLSLPQKIIRHHGVSGLAQLVLHELAHDHNFKLKKAIYLADNPEFDHLLGVAGYSQDDCGLHAADVWQNPEKEISSINESLYSKNIKNFLQKSMKAQHLDFHNKEEIEGVGKQLGIEKPQFLSWDLKHGNHGLLIFEYADSSSLDLLRQKLFTHAAALLGFCPIF